MAQAAFDVSLQKRFRNNTEIVTIANDDNLLIHDKSTGKLLTLPFSVLTDALIAVLTASFEPTIVAGTTAQYWRGDKSWQTLNKTAVGLGSVDNTADAAKSVSYAATAGAAPASDVYAWAKASVKPTYTKAEVGLTNADNTSDADKPVSTAQAASIATKQNSFNGIIVTASGSYASAPNNTDVVLTTLPNVGAGVWLVNLAVAAGSASTWSTNYLLNTQGTTSSLTRLFAPSGGISADMNGLDLRGNQSSGIALPIEWSVTRIM